MRLKSNTSDPAYRRLSRILIVGFLGLRLVAPYVVAATSGNDLRETAQEVRELAPDFPIERDISPDENHSYRIRLASGEFLRLRVESIATVATVEVLDPDNRQLFSGSLEGVASRRVFVLAHKAGDYRLGIASLKKEGNSKGRYAVTVGAPVASTAEDRSRVAAQQLQNEAGRLYEQQTADSLREAVEKDLEALKIWESLSDLEGQAETLNHLGTLYYDLSEKRNAFDSLNRAVELFAASGNRAEEATALSDLGVASLALNEPGDALRFFERALPLRRASLKERPVESRSDEAIIVYHVGCAYRDMGEYQKALINFRLALPMWEGSGHAYTLHGIGGVYARLGEAQKAIDYFGQAMTIWWRMGNDPLSSLASRNDYSRRANGELVNIGLGYASMGQWKQALENYEQELVYTRQSKLLEPDAAKVLSKMGFANLALGNYQKSLDNFDEALPVLQKDSDLINAAATMRGVGEVHVAWSEPQKAIEYFNRALSLQHTIADQSGEAATLFSIAHVHRDMEQLEKARGEIELALDLIENTRSKVTSTELRASYMASKQDYYEFYIDLLMRLDSKHPNQGYAGLALKANERSRARSLLDVFNETSCDIREGVDPSLLERERAIRQRLNAKAEHLTRIPNKNTKETTEAKKEIESLLIEYQEVQGQIRAKSPRYAALTQPKPLALNEIQQQVLDSDTLLLEYALGSQRSYVWAVTPSSIESFELPKRSDIEAAARNLYELLANGSKRELQTQIRIASAQVSRMILGPVAGVLGNKRLLIVADESLQFIPFAALPSPVKREGLLAASYQRKSSSDQDHSKEAEVLTDDWPLIVDHEIINLPSASALAVLRQELAGRRVADKAVAIIADPVLQADDPRVRTATSRGENSTIRQTAQLTGAPPSKEEMTRSASESGVVFDRLPYTRQEADAIAALAPREKMLEAVDFDASRTGAVNAGLGQYQIVHFATHGMINSQHPELSGLVLSLVDEQGRPQDGFLRLEDVYNLKLGADLVVLSACRTALGKEVKGEGLMGLTRGFMYAGAARVVASLWDVKDESTAELMKRFYSGMLKEGLRPSAALRAAQVSMWKEKRWEKPYYWAAFSLQGEWK